RRADSYEKIHGVPSGTSHNVYENDANDPLEMLPSRRRNFDDTPKKVVRFPEQPKRKPCTTEKACQTLTININLGE
ncbi:hypothetical protein FRB94_003378, partial [Tulasnella sp. JGI-2019a]